MIRPAMPQWFRELVDKASTEHETRQTIAQAVWEGLMDQSYMTEDPFFYRIHLHIDAGATPEGWWDDVEAEQDTRRGYDPWYARKK